MVKLQTLKRKKPDNFQGASLIIVKLYLLFLPLYKPPHALKGSNISFN